MKNMRNQRVKRYIITGLALSMVLLLVCGCTAAAPGSQAPKGSEASDTASPSQAELGPILMERSVSMVEQMGRMAQSEGYRQMMGTSSMNLEEKIIAMGQGDYSKPSEVYRVQLAGEKTVEAILAIGEITEALSEEMKTLLSKRVILSIPSMLSGQGGVEMLTVSSMMAAQSCFVLPELVEPTLLLLVYEGDWSASVSYIPGEDGAVSASAMFLGKEVLPESSDMEEFVANFEEVLGYEVAKIEKIASAP